MAKTTIYLNKEAEEIYQVAKEYAGDNLSAVIVQGLKLYVDKMDTMTKGMEEVIIFDGIKNLVDMISRGKNLKFIGIKLAETPATDLYGDSELYVFRLYLTRKGKFLVDKKVFTGDKAFANYSYKVFDTFSKVTEEGYPDRLLNDARKNMPEVACEELDV